MLYALEHPADVTAMPNQKLDGKPHPAIGLKVSQYQFTVLFDRKTRIAGDSTFDTVLSDWKAVGGVQIAHTKSGRLNGIEVARRDEWT